jgi:tetratricopeptide (TPR) repeat protein
VWRPVLVLLAISSVAADVPTDRAAALATFGAARLQQRKDNTVQAVKSLEAAAKLDPDALAPKRELVTVYADLGRDAAAIRTAKAVLAADPHDADTAHHLAKLLFEVKRYAEAAAAITAALDGPRLADRATKSLAMRTDLARCRDRANDFAAEAAWRGVRDFLRTAEDQLLREGFKQAELDHESASASEKLGHALLARKKPDDATAAFLSARDLFADPKRANDPAAAARLHRNLADVAAATGDAATAVKHLERYLAFKPRDVPPYEKYAEQLRKAGQNPVAKLQALPEPAAKWVALAEMSRTPAGFGNAHPEFADLAKETTDPAFFKLLVKTYATADSGSGLLDIADALMPPPAMERPKKPPVVPAADAARRQAFAAALAAHPEVAVKMARAARLSPDARRSPELWDVLAWACQRAGDAREVEDALRAALRANDAPAGNFRAFQRLQRHLYAQRKWQAILDLCNESQDLGGGVLNYYRAAPLAELNQPEAALRAIAKAEGDNAFASRREKIHVLEILGRHADMLKECDAAMDEFRSPGEGQSLRYLRAQAFLGLKRFADAEAELRGILEEDADDVLALNNLGYNLADQNRKLDEAERLIRRAIEIDTDERVKAGDPSPDHAAYLDSLGWVLFRRGHLTAAREQLEKAAGLADGLTDPTIWDHLGDVTFRLGEAKAAKAAWAKAEKLYATTHQGRQQGRREEVGRKLKLVE